MKRLCIPLLTFGLFGIVAMTPEPVVPGVTSIVKFVNKSGSELKIYKREDRGNFIDPLLRGEEKYYGMWIPWVENKPDFESKAIDIQFPSGKHIYIWQRNVNGDDRVRYSRTGWADPGDIIPGNSSVNGDRVLTIYDDRVELN